MAMYRTGIRTGDVRKNAHGFGLIVLPEGACVRLDAVTVERARACAVKVAMNRPVVLARAVARGRVVLWECLERIDLKFPALADGALVAPGGHLIEKETNFYSDVDFRSTAKRLAGQLRYVDRKFIWPRLEYMLDRLGVDWTKLTATQIRDVFGKANKYMRGLAWEKVLPTWEGKVNATLKIVAGGVRRQIRDNFLPRLGTSFTRNETAALGRIGEQQGWFLRNQQLNISNAMTTRGQSIVADGLKNGLGRREIGDRLWKQLPDMWNGMGKRYADVVAANAVSRARSWGEISSYQLAGVEMLEVQAVLDERTTEVCRFMDGQVINVSGCAEHSQRAANVSNPEDIYKVSPFMQMVANKDNPKEPILQTRLGDRIATMTRSGLGRVDDRGSWKASVMGNGLLDKQIGPPPYHHACRSMTVPRVESFQVPQSYKVRTMNVPPVIPKVKPKPKAPGPFAVRPPGVPPGVFAIPPRPKPRHKPTPLRPVEVFPPPTPGGTVSVVSPDPMDDFIIPADFLGKTPTGFVRSKNQWGVSRPYIPGKDRAFVPATDRFVVVQKSEYEKIINGGGGEALFKGVGDSQSALLQIGTRTGLGPSELTSFVVNPNNVGRDVIFRFVSKSGASQVVRVTQLSGANGSVRAAVRSLANRTMTDDMARAWLRKAETEGWVRIGTQVDDVATSIYQRVMTVPPVVTPGPLKVSGKPLPGPPVMPTPKPAKPPRAGALPPVKPPQTAFRNSAVSPEIYAARPAGEKVLESLWSKEFGYVRTVSVEGTVAKTGNWRKVPLKKISRGFLNYIDPGVLELGARDRVVSMFVPTELTPYQMKHVYVDIIKGEMGRGFGGVREYIIHDARGKAFFVRFNGEAVKALGKRKINPLLDSVLYGVVDERTVALRTLRGAVAESTLQVKQFYPNAVVDWSRPGLIPGVPIGEQALTRVAAIRDEVTEALRAALKKKGANLTDSELGTVLTELAKKYRHGVKSPHELVKITNPARSSSNRKVWVNTVGRSSPRTILRTFTVDSSKLVKKAIDDTLEHASDSFLMAAQTRPMPIFTTGPGFRRSWFSGGGGFGKDAVPSVVTMAPQVNLDIAYTKVGRAADSLHRLSRPKVRHEMQHFLDTVGMNGPAARAVRNSSVSEGKMIDVYGTGKEWALPGRMVDKYDFKLYQTDLEGVQGLGLSKSHTAGEYGRVLDKALTSDVLQGTYSGGEFATKVHERFARGYSDEISVNWRQSPDQVAFYLAMMRGAFVPF